VRRPASAVASLAPRSDDAPVLGQPCTRAIAAATDSLVEMSSVKPTIRSAAVGLTKRIIVNRRVQLSITEMLALNGARTTPVPFTGNLITLTLGRRHASRATHTTFVSLAIPVGHKTSSPISSAPERRSRRRLHDHRRTLNARREGRMLPTMDTDPTTSSQARAPATQLTSPRSKPRSTA
jgi:hypothetical protein